MGVSPKSYWVHSATYPQGKSFGEILDWHLVYAGTGNSSPRPWKLVAFAREINGQREDCEDEEIAQKLRWWRQGLHLPDNEKLLRNILRVLFGENEALADWKSDLERAWRTARAAKSNVTVINENSKVLPFSQTSAAEQNIPLIKRGLSNLYGRRSDLKKINDFVVRRTAGEASGLMVITAPAGFGKTTLAIHWCDEVGLAPNRHIVSHLCSAKNGAPTTTLENIYTHLCQKLARIHGDTSPILGSETLLISQLIRPAPNGQEIVVWLDGIDEAKDDVSCFLPEILGERVCVIVSARAEKGVIPGYLSPWLAEDMALSHDVFRHELDKLSLEDVEELVAGLFSEKELPIPNGLADKIYGASDGGYALFAHEMTKTAIISVLNNERIDLGESPHSLLGYAKSEINRLEKLRDWHIYKPLFYFLTIAKEAVDVDEINIFVNFDVSVGSLPQQFARWIVLVEVDGGTGSFFLSFAHPKLRDVFYQASGSRSAAVVNSVCTRLLNLDRAYWPDYAWRHLPDHLLESGHHLISIGYLTSIDFIAERYEALGADSCSSAMERDWRELYNNTDIKNDHYDIVSQNLRFWANFSAKLRHLNYNAYYSVVKQLMRYVCLSNNPVCSGLENPKSCYLPSSIAHYVGHKNSIKGVCFLDGGAKVLSWGIDGTLRIWGRLGGETQILRGHECSINGVLPIEDAASFISWSEDKTLRLWRSTGEARAIFRGHTDIVTGALPLPNGNGFLSWSMDCTLRLWGGDRRRAWSS